QRAATVAGIDDGIGLNPGAGPVSFWFSDRADNASCDAEEQALPWIANGNDALTLTHAADVGEREVGKLRVCAGRVDFGERDVQVVVDVNDFRVELLAPWKNCEQRLFSPGDVGVGCNHARAGDKKS